MATRDPTGCTKAPQPAVSPRLGRSPASQQRGLRPCALQPPPLPPAAPSAPRRPGTSEPGANPEPRCRQLGLKGPGRSPPSLPLAAPARSSRARVPAVVELVSLRPALPSAGVDPRLPLLTGDKAQPFQGPPRDARAHRLLPRATLGASLVTWQGVLHLSASGRHG